MTSLSSATLPALPPIVASPQYDRASLSAGILHFGVGNFHRAHQALYLQNLFNQGKDHDWAIIGAGVLPCERPHFAALNEQNYLSTLVEQSADKSLATVLGSMIDCIEPANTPAILDVLSKPYIRIVSMTITEGGYYLDQSAQFDSAHPDIAHDAENVECPMSVFGIIVRALQMRKQNNIPPFTVMSCDNIPHNGDVARNAVCGLAWMIDPSFADWIAQNVCFPNSMVDRITPVTGDREREILQRDFGIVDRVPVFCEDFRQWVLEDSFSMGRPSWQDVGVQFVPDVTPYEIMKIRVLNGGHASIGYPAALMDIEYVHEAMRNPLITAYLNKLEKEEILPAVPPVPDTSVEDYLKLICKRFANPKIGDTIQRLCWDGSNRQPKFIVPTIKDRIENKGSTGGLALVAALWCKYCGGTTDSGVVIKPNDLAWDSLQEVAADASEEPVQWLQQKLIYGDLENNKQFVARFTSWFRMLQERGTEAALRSYIE